MIKTNEEIQGFLRVHLEVKNWLFPNQSGEILMKKILALTFIATLPIFALAHHGANSQFDTSVEISYTGLVTELGFVNPHSYVSFEMTDENGEYILDEEGNRVEVHCEMLSGTSLRRAGWTEEMFKPGTAIKVGGNPSRKEENVCVLETMVLNDGPVMSRFEQIPETRPEVDLDRAALTAWGDPNIGGDWAAEARVARPAQDAGAPDTSLPVTTNPELPLTAAGRSAVTDIAARIRAGELEINRLNCEPRDFFSDWTFNWMPNRIVQEQDKIYVTYGFMDRERIIHMDMDEHPANLEPDISGHSIGHWENDVLVIDTIGFTESFRYRGTSISNISSSQLHVVERFRVDNDQGTLTRDYVAEDPLYWEPSYKRTGQDVLSVSNLPWEPYNCNDLTVE